MTAPSCARRFSHIAIMMIFVSILGGCAASTLIGYKTSPDYPKDETAKITAENLNETVSIYLDSAGIAHIEAQDERDLLYAIGFVQGRSRFFGMDGMRRIARGRLSELVGEQPLLDSTTVAFDLSMRGWGFDKASETDDQEVDEETRLLLESFVAGVNKALELYPPLEHRLLGVEPEPWKLSDCFAIGRLVTWSISQNWHQEASRLLLALTVGIDRAERIYGNDFWRGGTSLPPLDVEHMLPPAIAEELREMLPEHPYEELSAMRKQARIGIAPWIVRQTAASNSWTVHGAHTASGKPILANDPHLAHMLPSMMFQQHIKSPTIDAIGGTISGLPYILAGHNKNVAWGMTSSCGDVMDLYIEKPIAEDPDSYLTANGPAKFVNEEQIIRVRDGSKLEERKFIIRRSVHGPIMNDMYPELFPSWAPPVSIHWDLSGAAKAIPGLRIANQAQSIEDFRKAMTAISTPSIAWSTADSSGRIAMFATGRIPIRHHHLGTFPAPGWLAHYEWDGYLDPMELPYGDSTDGGYFAHGNNIMRSPEHDEVFFQIDSAPSYRHDRIIELLAKRNDHDWQSMAEIQRDVLLHRARMVVPGILEALDKSESWSDKEKAAIDILRSWDSVASSNSPAAAIFFLTYREAIMEALRDELTPAAFKYVMSQRYSTNVADLWFSSSKHIVWDDRATEAVESREDVIAAAFAKAVAKLIEDQDENPSAWRWGKLHDLHFKHIFGSKKVLDSLVNLEHIESGGGLDSVWKSHFDLGHPKLPFRAMAGPSYRMIVDFADMEHGHWVIETGNSGWPGSPHYGDQFELWKRGLYLPMISNWGEIRTNAKAKLTLEKPEKTTE